MKEQQTLIELSKRLISAQTVELNNELSKLSDNTSESDRNDILTDVDGIIAKLNSRISQLKAILSS